MKFPPWEKGFLLKGFRQSVLLKKTKTTPSIWIYRWMIDQHSWESKRTPPQRHLIQEIRSCEGSLNHHHPPNNHFNRALFLGGNLAFGMGPPMTSFRPVASFPTAPYHSFNDITGQNSASRIAWINHSLGKTAGRFLRIRVDWIDLLTLTVWHLKNGTWETTCFFVEGLRLDSWLPKKLLHDLWKSNLLQPNQQLFLKTRCLNVVISPGADGITLGIQPKNTRVQRVQKGFLQ